MLVVGSAVWVYFDAKKIGARRNERGEFLAMGPVGCHKDLPEEPQAPTVSPPPLSPPAEPEKLVRNWIADAQKFGKEGDYESAVRAFSSTLEELPLSQAFYGRAVAYSKLGDRQNMLSDLKAAANFGHPKAKEALAKIVKAQRAKGQKVS